MGDHVGKSIRLAQGVSGAPAGHVGQIQAIHNEPFFRVGAGDGVAYVPASYIDAGYQPCADPMDDDCGEMDNEPVPTSDADQPDVPSIASIAGLFDEWRHRHHW